VDKNFSREKSCENWRKIYGGNQQYETLLEEINSHPGSEEVPPGPDQYEVETAALADRNLNVPCESGIQYPSLVAMLNRWDRNLNVPCESRIQYPSLVAMLNRWEMRWLQSV
jgi:hypothetical protein